MEGEIVAAIVGAVFFLTMGGVIFMRPIAKRLSQFLEVLIDQKRQERTPPSAGETHRLMESLENRLAALERRADFTEDLLGSRETRRVVSESTSPDDTRRP